MRVTSYASAICTALQLSGPGPLLLSTTRHHATPRSTCRRARTGRGEREVAHAPAPREGRRSPRSAARSTTPAPCACARAHLWFCDNFVSVAVVQFSLSMPRTHGTDVRNLQKTSTHALEASGLNGSAPLGVPTGFGSSDTVYPYEVCRGRVFRFSWAIGMKNKWPCHRGDFQGRGAVARKSSHDNKSRCSLRGGGRRAPDARRALDGVDGVTLRAGCRSATEGCDNPVNWFTAHGTNTLNCTAHGFRRRCVAQFSLPVPPHAARCGTRV